MLFKIQNFLYFLWNSKNQHGVHSPFVYNLVTKCFYKKTSIKEIELAKKLIKKIPTLSTKQSKLLAKIGYYFNVKNIITINENTFYTIKVNNPNLNTESDNNQLIIFNKPVSLSKTNKQLKNYSIHKSNTFIIYNNIYQNTETKKAWQIIKRNPTFHVTIDTFKWGFAFFREEQEKEHFIIRI